jgi:cytochrome d ubiquinol oxidase subunit II
MLGVLAVATAAYLAAVYLAADAVRVGRGDLERDFRARALGTAVVAGGAALAGLVVLRFDARPIWDGLTSGAGLAAVVVSAIGGIGTIFFVLRRRYEPARVTAAVAVAAIVAGWGLAQRPQFLPGLTIDQAAAGRSTLVSLLVSLALGAVVLVPSLAFLFTLVLRGRFDESTEPPAAEPEPGSAWASRRLLPVAAVCLVAGAAVTALVDSAWGRVVGIPLLFASIVLAFLAIAPALSAVAAHEDDLP